jgi:hypothetical protein
VYNVDFEYTETAVQGLLKPKLIDTQLRGMTGPWARRHGDITMKDYCDYRRVLTQACVAYRFVFCFQFSLANMQPVS